MRALIADDDPAYRTLLADLLAEWDFEVVLASDGMKALGVMRGRDCPRLVLLDWEMPGADGFEVAKSIRAEQHGSGPYILMITSNRKKQDLMRVLVCGADDYLIKPFDPMDLKIHLRSAMRILSLQEELEALARSS